VIAKHGIEGAARVLRALAGERSTRRESGNLHLRRAPSGSQGLSFPVFPPPRSGRDGGDARDPAAPCPGPARCRSGRAASGMPTRWITAPR